jgi:hypothetical protein
MANRVKKLQNLPYPVMETNKKLKIVSYNITKHCCLPDTTVLDHTIPLSVQKLEIIVCSDWLVGSQRAS